jgi:hypothetical protein
VRRTTAKKSGAKATPRTKKPRGPGAIETVTVDVIEETAPGVITVTEFEETEVREEDEGPEQPEETPPESEER